MELVLFTGIPATGKSSFYKERFFRTHVRVNRDMLKTRRREDLLIAACLAGKTRLVVDNTNLRKAERAHYISAAKAGGFAVIGYFFQSLLADALRRNQERPEQDRIAAKGVMGGSGRLELPSRREGFDELYFVRIDPDAGFTIDPWREAGEN